MANIPVSPNIDTFLQSEDNAAACLNLGVNLDSVTDNGATTVNDISVGKIATLHPTNTIDNNAANGGSSASIAGVRNIADGARSATFGGQKNNVSGNDSTALGGNGQSIIGRESEGLGSTNTTLNTKYTTAIGTANSSVGVSGSGDNSVDAKHSVILGGEKHTIENAQQAVIVGGGGNLVGEGNTILTGHNRSVILGGKGITTDATDTAFVDNLDVKDSIYLTTGAVEVPKEGKWQLYVDPSGTLWVSGINGMSKRQVAFV